MSDQHTPAWRRYLRLLGPDARGDLADEFEFHIATRADELRAGGMSADAARRAAEEEFGNRAGAEAACLAIDQQQRRRDRIAAFLDTLRMDVRYAARALRRSPGFTVVAALTLALGIGANTAIFSVVHAVLLRSLPYPHAERLVRIWETTPQGNDRNVASPGNYTDWRARSTSFAAMGVHFPPIGVTMTGAGEPERVIRVGVSPSAMIALGEPPLLGRSFTEEDAKSGERLVLLSAPFWRTHFGADPGIIGRSLTLDGQPFTVVGVMPADFAFPTSDAQVWTSIPDAAIDATQRRSHNWSVVARLADGVSLERAQAEMQGIAASLTREYPQFMTGYGVNVVPFHADLVAGVRPLLLILFGGAGLVLLVACANIANLLLARAMTREREMAVRGALGAGRGRLVRQLLTESVALAGLGGVLGLGLAAVLLRRLVVIAPRDIPLLDTVRLEPAVLVFLGLAAAGSTLVFGLVPALRLASADLQSTLRAGRDATGGVRHARLRAALLVGEVAVSLTLLVGAGLLLRSASRLAQVDYGYRTDHLLAINLDLPRAVYDSSAKHAAFYEGLLERVRALPGVTGASSTTEPPAGGFNMTFSWAIQGRPATNPSGREDPQPLRVVTSDFFLTTGIPLLAGRAFDARDRRDAPPVLIVNRALARRYFPNGDAIGSRLSFEGAGGPWLEIVGIVGDTRQQGADVPPGPAVYLPFAQKRWDWMSWQSLMIRLADGASRGAVTSGVRNAVHELDPRLALQEVNLVDELYAAGMARRRFATALLGGFAGLGLLLGAIGMYGVVAYTVAQRRRDIGIRMALGARGGQIVRSVIGQSLRLALAGIVVGSAAALALSRTMASLLYEVSPTDGVTFAAVAVTLLVVALLAAWVPARRATRVDPLAAVRDA